MRKQTSFGFAWGGMSSSGLNDIHHRFETRFSIDYFTAHPLGGLEDDRCNNHDATIKLETVDDSNGPRSTQCNACSRRLSVLFLNGRPIRQRYSDEGDAEKFIDPNDPW